MIWMVATHIQRMTVEALHSDSMSMFRPNFCTCLLTSCLLCCVAMLVGWVDICQHSNDSDRTLFALAFAVINSRYIQCDIEKNDCRIVD